MEFLDTPIVEESNKNKDYEYPRFGHRWAANIIDFFIITVVYLFFTVLFFAIFSVLITYSFVNATQTHEYKGPILAFYAFLLGFAPMFLFFSLVFWWLYYAILESRKGGTVGKLLLGLRVIDEKGHKLTFGKASMRLFARAFSLCVISYIGHIVAGFSSKKQALHDLIAGTLVVKKQKEVLDTRIEKIDDFL